MAKDDYQYQSWPLPKVEPWGGSPESNAGIPQLDASSYPTASSLSVPSPFDNPASGGGGGGGGTDPTCATNWSIGNIATTEVVMPCDAPRSTYGPNALALDDDSGNTAEVSAVNQWIKLAGGDVDLNIDMGDAEADSVSIKLQEIDVCHMGQPGKRQFVAGDAYAAP